MAVGAVAVLLLALAGSAIAGPPPPQCSLPTPTSTKVVPLNAKNVAWGYFYKNRAPVEYVNSGETFVIEMATHLAGDYYEGMIKGDAGMEDIYKWTATEMNIKTRGATGRADGKHVMTGPVYICGAEAGDTIEIQILDMWPRKNPQGKVFSSNGLAGWGWQYRAGFRTHIPTDATFIYEIKLDKKGKAKFAVPQFYFTWKDAAGKGIVQTPCPPSTGAIPDQIPGSNLTWANPTYTFSGNAYNCTNGTVTWNGYHYAGVIVDHPISTIDYSVNGKWRVPANPHIGNIGLASDVNYPTNSAWPMRTGGNIDHKRLGKGSKLFLPVEVDGGLLMAGDVHCGQTASEYDGTALETNFNARLKVIVHKRAVVERDTPLYANLPTPLLENNNEWCWHGFTFNDYLHDPRLQPNPNAVLGSHATNTYMLMNNTAVVTRDGLMKLGFKEDEATTIMTFACDWEITQVVNTNMGNNMCCYKYIKSTGDNAYVPRTFPGSSRPMRAKISSGIYD